MNQTDRHTKMPWTHTKLDKWNYITRNNSTALPDIIATIEQNGDDEEANARHIVKCVNSHDALVEACKAALFVIKDIDTGKTLTELLESALKLEGEA